MAGAKRREKRVGELGRDLLERVKRLDPGGGLSDRLMAWAMRDEAFKTQLFRFIDVFPALHGPEDVHRHLEEYLRQPDLKPPPGLHLGLTAGGWAKGALARTVSQQVERMADRFIAGASAADALPGLRARWDEGIAFSLDLLGEACVSDDEADRERARFLEAVDRAADAVADWPRRDALETDHLGAVPRANLSVKITALAPKVDPVDADASIERVAARLEPIARRAGERGVLLNFDMEHRALKDLTLRLFERVCERVDFPAGIALQAYLRSAEDDADALARWARKSGRPVTVRLVKGAYWDFEMIHAEKRAWPAPVWRRKADTDACFERVADRLIAAAPRAPGAGGTKPAIGSHNARSICHALARAEEAGLPPEAVELQTLHGMAEGIKRAAVERGLRMREYVPVGEPIAGMAYLVRRLLENTSNESWLRAGFDADAPAERLLSSPHAEASRPEPADPRDGAPERHRLTPAVPGVGDGRPFRSEPPTDFADPEQRARFAEAAGAARRESIALTDDPADAERAVARAADAFPAWRDTPAQERANRLVGAAARLRAARGELAGVMMRESAKNWPDADADVGEAIDFLEYYARQGARLFEPKRRGRFVGEDDRSGYEPRGVAAVIPPWNLPLAITAGMTAAALVTGNKAVVKPAEQSPAIAKRLCEAL